MPWEFARCPAGVGTTGAGAVACSACRGAGEPAGVGRMGGVRPAGTEVRGDGIVEPDAQESFPDLRSQRPAGLVCLGMGLSVQTCGSWRRKATWCRSTDVTPTPQPTPSPDWSTPSAADMRQAAVAYAALGWRVFPVGWLSEAPSFLPCRCITQCPPGEGWQKHALQLTGEDLSRHFNQRRNLGVLLGDVSGGLVVVTFDCPEAVEMAPRLLPSTWTFGRGSKPRSHWVYMIEGARSEQLKDTTTMIFLHGAPGGAMRQVVFPPSVHHSGGQVQWTDDCDAQESPRILSADDLHCAVATLDAACLVMRHAGREAALSWLDGAPCPALPPEVAKMVRACAIPLARSPQHGASGQHSADRAACPTCLGRGHTSFHGLDIACSACGGSGSVTAEP